MSETTLKDIAALLDSGKLSERDLAVLEAQLTKLEKLKALHDCNSYVFEKMPIQSKVNHIGNASVRRDRILGGENAATT